MTLSDRHPRHAGDFPGRDALHPVDRVSDGSGLHAFAVPPADVLDSGRRVDAGRPADASDSGPPACADLPVGHGSAPVVSLRCDAAPQHAAARPRYRARLPAGVTSDLALSPDAAARLAQPFLFRAHAVHLRQPQGAY